MSGSASALVRTLSYCDLVAVARAVERQSLANVGLDCKGRWVGFSEAASMLAAETGDAVLSSEVV